MTLRGFTIEKRTDHRPSGIRRRPTPTSVLLFPSEISQPRKSGWGVWRSLSSPLFPIQLAVTGDLIS